jgi:transcriptional regulator with PAS, ATPase and Fis domain
MRRKISARSRQRTVRTSRSSSINSSSNKRDITKSRREEAQATCPGQHPLPSLREIEHDHIQAVLSHVHQNKTKAAEILGIDRVSLWRKIKKYKTAESSCHPAE